MKIFVQTDAAYRMRKKGMGRAQRPVSLTQFSRIFNLNVPISPSFVATLLTLAKCLSGTKNARDVVVTNYVISLAIIVIFAPQGPAARHKLSKGDRAIRNNLINTRATGECWHVLRPELVKYTARTCRTLKAYGTELRRIHEFCLRSRSRKM